MRGKGSSETALPQTTNRFVNLKINSLNESRTEDFDTNSYRPLTNE